MSASPGNTTAAGRLFGWIRSLFTGLLGLISGAAAMYVSPLIEEAVKPPRPIPNFTVKTDGLKATFENRSDGKDGWWDFGDGTALEPFSADQKQLVHDYQRPGEYQAKLILSNLLGEASERQVPVVVGESQSGPPTIDTFKVEAVEANRYAPATFRVTFKASHTDRCLLACDGNHPLKVITNPSVQQEQYVTLTSAGNYQIRLAAMQGDTLTEKIQEVQVQSPPARSVMAIVKITDQAVHIKGTKRPRVVRVSVPKDFQGSVYSFKEEIQPDKGYLITEADLLSHGNEGYVRNVKVQPSKDGKSAVLSGEFLVSEYPARSKFITPSWVAMVKLKQQHERAHAAQSGDAVFSHLQVNGVTTIPLPTPPRGWLVKARHMEMVLMDGNRPIWRGNALPRNTPVIALGRPCIVNATQVGNAIQIQVLEQYQGINFNGN